MLDAHHKSAWDTMLVVGMIFEVEMDTELGYDLISKNACNGYLKNAEITNPFTNWWLSLVQIDLQVGWMRSVKFGWFLPVIYFSWNLGECIVIPNWTSHQLQTIFWGASYFWSAYYTPRIGLYIFHLPLSLSLHILYAIYIYILYIQYIQITKTDSNHPHHSSPSSCNQPAKQSVPVIWRMATSGALRATGWFESTPRIGFLKNWEIPPFIPRCVSNASRNFSNNISIQKHCELPLLQQVIKHWLHCLVRINKEDCQVSTLPVIFAKIIIWALHLAVKI